MSLYLYRALQLAGRVADCMAGSNGSESTAPIGRTACSWRPAVNQRQRLGEPARYLGGGLRRIELDAISPSALCGIQGDVSALNQPV